MRSSKLPGNFSLVFLCTQEACPTVSRLKQHGVMIPRSILPCKTVGREKVQNGCARIWEDRLFAQARGILPVLSIGGHWWGMLETMTLGGFTDSPKRMNS